MSQVSKHLIFLFTVFCFLAAEGHSSSKCSRSNTCKPCSTLNKQKCKVKKGCVTIAARVQEFFAGFPVCSVELETVPQAKIYFRQQGKVNHKKPTIVFIHGFGETGDIWKCAQSELCDRFCTVAMDLRGFGRSSKTAAAPDSGGIHYTTRLNTRDIHELLSKLGITENIILVSHSLGSNTALRYAVDYPDQVVKMVLVGALPFLIPDCAVSPTCSSGCLNPFTCDPTFCYPFGITTSGITGLEQPLTDCLIAGGDEKDCLALWGKFLAPIWYNEPCQEKLQKAQAGLVSAVVSSTVSIINSAVSNGGTEDFSALLPSIQAPALICYGSIDIIINPGNSFFIHDNLPNSILAEFVGKGHQLHVTDYKNFNRLVSEFIEACQMPDFIKVLDQGCCICPLTGPVDYARKSCSN